MEGLPGKSLQAIPHYSLGVYYPLVVSRLHSVCNTTAARLTRGGMAQGVLQVVPTPVKAAAVAGASA